MGPADRVWVPSETVDEIGGEHVYCIVLLRYINGVTVAVWGLYQRDFLRRGCRGVEGI